MFLLYCKNNQFDYTHLTRSEETLAKYLAYLDDLNKSGKDINDEIKKIKFGHPNQVFALCQNDFPYDLPANQSHWLLWVNTAIAPKLSEETIIEYIKSSFAVGSVEAIWINEIEDRSVKDVLHYHVVVLG